MNQDFITIPTWDNGVWTTTSFSTREDFRLYILTLFKEPGEYAFDETSHEFNAQAHKFRKDGIFCNAPTRSKDFIAYWDDQKLKCRRGALYHNKGKTWYLTRDYYMFLNFLQINDKAAKKFDFPGIRDVQYHMALYELLAELHYQHVAILKKRQMASSYFHCAKMINLIWFEETPIIKMGASHKDYINLKGTWKFLNEFRSFLNKNTAWYRDFTPGGEGLWQQQIEEKDENGRVSMKGLKGVMSLTTFERDATNGVGGACTLFFHEEAGIAPKMGTTVEFLYPALEDGELTTGLFVAAGSVGELDQCKPLQYMMYHPSESRVYAVENKYMDSKGTIGMTGLFIPEQYSMPPYIDDFGNSLVTEALAALDRQREQWKKDLEPNIYQFRVSQKPRNMEEAFAFRSVSVFPQHLVSAQTQRIEDKEYPIEYVDLSRDATGKIIAKASNKLPIREFPMTKKTEDKTGVIEIFERPDEKAEWGTYYASVDPVSEGKAESVDNMVYTPFGKERIGDIKVGDMVIGSSGLNTLVTGVFPQGVKKLYRVYFSDGHSLLVCDEHLWNVKLNGGTKGFITVSTKDLMDEDKKISYCGTGRNKDKTYTVNTFIKNKKGGNRWHIPIIDNPISFYHIMDEDEATPVDPYFLGLLIGDGGLSQRGIRFSSVDQELIDYIKSVLPKDITIKKVGNSKCDYRISIDSGHRNTLSIELRYLNLQGKRSEYKFIPNQYQRMDPEERLALLQGLMDTDGSCTNHGAEFYSSSKQLAYDVVDLVQGLGGIAKIRMKKTTHLNSYVVRVLLPVGMCPFRLSRKKIKYVPSKVFSRYITDIRYEKEGEAVCISVAAEDKLYVTEHAIVTHNTTTSESLCSIYVYKNPVEVTRIKDGEDIESFIERDKIVACWTGRFDDINSTHERLELIIEWYKARTIIENNISLFIRHMIAKRMHKYLVPKNEITFLKDAKSNDNVFQEYGWKNTGTLFKAHLLSYLIEFLKEEIETETKEDGTIVKRRYGIERIPDIMAMVEMKGYADGVNVDRLVSLAALIAFAKVQQSNLGYKKRVERQDSNLQKSDKMFKLHNSPFRHIGGNGGGMNGMKKPRNPYKNLR